MVITVPAGRSQFEGLRPVSYSRDIPQIADLLRLVFKDTLDAEDRQWLGEFGTGSGSGSDLRNGPGSSRLASGFVWEANGRIVGNVTLLPTKTGGRYLVANVAVHPSYRRRGIARMLMQAVSDSVRDRGGRFVLLQVVKDNEPAISLYRSFGYQFVGNMTTWYTTPNRLRQPAQTNVLDQSPEIRPLAKNMWREAYKLDTACVPADLNWPEPLHPEAYKRTILRRFDDFLNGRLLETWATCEGNGSLTGLASIFGEWGRAYLLSIRVDPSNSGKLERPLLAKVIRRLSYLPRRNIRIDHPEDDKTINQFLTEANFTPQRTLTHMRLDLHK